jgi:tetratricopeptide (TPR) repeat protein
MTLLPSRAGRTLAARFASSALAAVLFAELALPAVARADDTKVHTAEDLANQAYAQASEGKYAEAISSYMKAYEVSKAPAILFNIAAICDRRLHERKLAMEYYRRYLEANDLDPEFAKKATERLSALKAEMAAEDKARSSVPIQSQPAEGPGHDTAPPPPPERSNAMLPLGIVVGSVGLAAAGVGLALGVMAKGKYDQANVFCGQNWCGSSEGVNLDQQANSLATASTGTVIGGAVLIALGVTFIVAGLPHHKSGSPTASISVTPQVGPSSGGMAVVGSF